MSRPRRVRPVRRHAVCPGCLRDVRLLGHLELLPPHTVPAPPDYSRDESGGKRSRALPPCPWAGDPMPGRPDGHVSRADATRLAARQVAERSAVSRAA